MKRLLLVIVILLGAAFAFPEYRAKGLALVEKATRSLPIPDLPDFASLPDLKSIASRFEKTDKEDGYPGAANFPLNRDLRQNSRAWTFTDGSELNAVLVAADTKTAQFRVPQGVGQVKVDLLAPPDREKIQSLVRSEGINGVAGLPISLKTHRWPHDWRESPEVTLEQVGDTDLWRSRHFEITNTAEIKREALEAITLICESVDGALSALPLPLPINWGRDPGERRKIQIKDHSDDNGSKNLAGYWDGRTGIVHIYANALLEPDLQLVVFEFNKPEKVQKYDVIVHEVTHQSMAALLYMGVPAWVPEGIAEYMSATQFAPAFYQFTNTHVSIRHHLDKRLLGDRIVKNRKMHFTHLRDLMGRDIFAWNAFGERDDVTSFLQYHESLILIDYFFHRDHPDGIHFRRYLESILSGVPEPEARNRHLMRGRSYEHIEREIVSLWKPLGFSITYQSRSELKPGDVTIDWAAEEIKRTIAARRAALGSQSEE
jgi:hypothetical protein